MAKNGTFIDTCISGSYDISNMMPKADPGPARRARAPPFEKKNGTFFGKFSLYIRKYFDFSQHAVFKICILFTTLLTKT